MTGCCRLAHNKIVRGSSYVLLKLSSKENKNKSGISAVCQSQRIFTTWGMKIHWTPQNIKTTLINIPSNFTPATMVWEPLLFDKSSHMILGTVVFHGLPDSWSHKHSTSTSTRSKSSTPEISGVAEWLFVGPTLQQHLWGVDSCFFLLIPIRGLRLFLSLTSMTN